MIALKKTKKIDLQNKIILEVFNNKSIEGYCRSLDSNNFDELKSELIIQLYKMDLQKLIAYHNNNCLTYICFTIIKRIKFGTISDTGIFFSKLNYDELKVNKEIQYEEEENTTDKDYLKLESEIKQLHWYKRTLFEMYHIQNMTLKMISEKTGINIKSIHYSLKITRQELKKKLQKDD